MTLVHTPRNAEEMYNREHNFLEGAYNNFEHGSFEENANISNSFFHQPYSAQPGHGFSVFDENQQRTYSGTSTPGMNLDFFEFGSHNAEQTMNNWQQTTGSVGMMDMSYSTSAEVNPNLLQQNMFQHNQQHQPALPPTVFEATYQGESSHLNTQLMKEHTLAVNHGQITPVASESPPSDKPSESKKHKSSVGDDIEARQELTPPEDPIPPKPKRGRRKKNKQLSEREKLANRERFLERNRNAAAKCRSNKKAWQAGVQDRVKDLSGENARLINDVASLLAEVDHLRGILIQHSRSCDHAEDLHQYLDEMAKRVGTKAPTILTKISAAELQLEDPSIARVNADYTDKREIPLLRRSSGISASQLLRPSSVPVTPTAQTQDHRRNASLDFSTISAEPLSSFGLCGMQSDQIAQSMPSSLTRSCDDDFDYFGFSIDGSVEGRP